MTTSPVGPCPGTLGPDPTDPSPPLRAGTPEENARGHSTEPDLRWWHEVGWRWPLGKFLVAFGFWLGLLALGVWTQHWGARAALAVPLTMLSGFLFTLAHDAGHGSFSTSRTLNGVVGRLALVPSVHVFELWRLHHDLHHRHTNLRHRDFVWTPVTVAEYRDLPGWRRLWHRLCRHTSGVGLGLHYALEIWAPRMLWPRRRHGAQPTRQRLLDALALYGSLLTLALMVPLLVSAVDPDRRAGAGSLALTWALLFVVPLIGTHWLIGFVIFLNHTHPDIVWYDDPVEWSRRPVQLEGSAGVRFRGPARVLLPNRIMSHTVHHLDPGVPLRSLPAAQHNLLELHADTVTSWVWSPRRFREVLARCKLYDYESKRWLTYADAEAAA